MVTLKDIAEHLGLSQATVSRALNGFPEVREETRRRVCDASRQLGYTPNLNARKLATGRSGMVGIVLRSPDELVGTPTYAEQLASISHHLSDAGLDLLINSARRGSELDSVKRFVASRAVDGLILNTPEVDDQRVAYLLQAGFPFVVHGRTAEKVDYAYFDIDNNSVSTQSVNLLADLGHKRIALINGPSGLAFSAQRENAFREMIRKRELTAPDPFIVNRPMNEEEGYLYGKAWLSGKSGLPPTAVICTCLTQAQGLYRAAKEAGITIGKDLSVIAHDDVAGNLKADNFDPPLTATRSPLSDACKPLADIMVNLLAGADPKTLQIIVPVELIVRSSTTAAPKNGEKTW